MQRNFQVGENYTNVNGQLIIKGKYDYDYVRKPHGLTLKVEASLNKLHN